MTLLSRDHPPDKRQKRASASFSTEGKTSLAPSVFEKTFPSRARQHQGVGSHEQEPKQQRCPLIFGNECNLQETCENEEDEGSSANSNLVVCIKSCIPNYFADEDSHVFDQMQSCRKKTPYVDCETCRFDLTIVE